MVDEELVRFYRAPVRRQNFSLKPGTELGRVGIVMSYAGADGLLIDALASAPTVKGLVIAGMGPGGVSALMFDAIEQARLKGIPVVIGTRVPTGRIFPLSAAR